MPQPVRGGASPAQPLDINMSEAQIRDVHIAFEPHEPGTWTQIRTAAQPQTQTWPSATARAGTLPWPQMAGQSPHMRLFLSTLESPVPSFFIVLKPFSTTHWHIAVAPSSSRSRGGRGSGRLTHQQQRVSVVILKKQRAWPVRDEHPRVVPLGETDYIEVVLTNKCRLQAQER